MGAAHLPGQRGVIELLRNKGYKLRPIKMVERDSRHKEEIERLRVPVQFSRQTSADGFFSVNLPGKLYDFNSSYGILDQQQYADMSNGSYYMVTRINTNGILHTVVIKDNGCGIAEEHITRLFEPYYTSKRNGMGLGLAATLNILQSHKAHIDVTSALNQGTTFTISFPSV